MRRSQSLDFPSKGFAVLIQKFLCEELSKIREILFRLIVLTHITNDWCLAWIPGQVKSGQTETVLESPF